MADGFTVTWQQDKQLVETAYQAQEIVPFVVQQDPISDTSEHEILLYSGSFNVAYITIDGCSLTTQISSTTLPYTNYYGRNLLQILTPTSTQVILQLTSTSGNFDSLNSANHFFVRCNGSSIKLVYKLYSTSTGVNYRWFVYCSGTIFIMS